MDTSLMSERMKRRRDNGWLPLLILAIGLVMSLGSIAASLWAGETPPTAEAGDEGDQADDADLDEKEPREPAWWEKPQSEWTLDQVRSYQAFRYLPGGRSPFSFRMAAKKKKVEGDSTQTPKTTSDNKTGPGNNEPPPPAEQTKFFTTQIIKTELFMVAQDYKSAMTVAENVRNTVMNEWGGPPTNKDNYALFQKILSYEKTAKRLQQALDTRKEFEGLPIEIKGIRWTPYGSSTLVNDTIYEPGSILDGIHSQAPVQIETINEDSVIFIYKGQRFRKSVVPETDTTEK